MWRPSSIRGADHVKQLKEEYLEWVDEALKEETSRRETSWLESTAVESKTFTSATQTQLGILATGRRMKETNG